MRYTLMICAVLFVIDAYSQNTKGLTVPKAAGNSVNGKTYALVVGVSKYKNPAIPQLQYADRDAKAFRNYLVATGVDSNNITLLLNEKATNAEFWANISFLTDVARKGDKVFIYFSGHGDVENKTVVKDAYLLPYDAPKCVYPAGAIAVYLLKGWIATLSSMGIQAIFIADACRSGNLAGGREGMEAAAATLKENWQDEIKILSCQPGELSLEGKQWGGGRGLFSYELINGLAGMADKNKDGNVTLRELNLYLMEKVPDEATPLPQNPALYGNMEAVISVAAPGLLRDVAANDNKMLAMVAVKGFEESLLAGLDDTIKHNYRMFKAALDTGNYLDGDGKLYRMTRKVVLVPCAYYYYACIPDNTKTHLLVALMKRDLCSIIMEDADKTLNLILQNGGTYLSQFSRLQYAMQILRNILGDKKLNDIGFLPKLYTFEALANLWWIKDKSVIHNSIAIMDSAISIAPDAGYLYFIRGDFYQKEHKEKEALADYKKTIRLSPRLVYPYNRLTTIYTSKRMYDSLADTYQKLFLTDSNMKYEHWDEIAIAYAYMSNKDSAHKYIDIGLSIKQPRVYAKNMVDSFMISYQTSCYNAACAYSVLNEKSNALNYLEKSITEGNNDFANIHEDADLTNVRAMPEFRTLMKKHFPGEGDSTIAIFYINKALQYLFENNYSDAEKSCKKAIELNPSSNNYFVLGKICREEDKFPDAEKNFKKAIELNPEVPITYIGYAKLYCVKNDTKNALKYLEDGLKRGYNNYDDIRTDDRFDSIRMTMQFKALMKKYFSVQYSE